VAGGATSRKWVEGVKATANEDAVEAPPGGCDAARVAAEIAGALPLLGEEALAMIERILPATVGEIAGAVRGQSAESVGVGEGGCSNEEGGGQGLIVLRGLEDALRWCAEMSDTCLERARAIATRALAALYRGETGVDGRGALDDLASTARTGAGGLRNQLLMHSVAGVEVCGSGGADEEGGGLWEWGGDGSNLEMEGETTRDELPVAVPRDSGCGICVCMGGGNRRRHGCGACARAGWRVGWLVSPPSSASSDWSDVVPSSRSFTLK
jgi:hypothetical protein